MVKHEQDELTLTEFQESASALVDGLHRDGKPVYLTVDGQPKLVVQDAESYDQMIDRLDYFEAVEAIKVGFADIDAGRVYPADVAFAMIREKLGIPD